MALFNSAHRTWIARILLGLFVLVAVVPLTACDDSDDAPPPRPPDPRKNRPGHGKKKSKGLDPTGMVNVQITNPRWDMIKVHFDKMSTKRHSPVHDVFKPQVLNFIPRPELPEPEVAGPVADVEAEFEEVRGPLQLFPLSDYELLLVMSGTALPKALVVDPKGQTHVVTRDMRMGDAGGIVEHVSQYMVVVREPNSERPYKLTIAPPLMDMTTKLGSSSDSESETADATPAPKADGSEP